jgi:hypothetical protein
MFSSMLSNFSNPSPLQSVRLATTAALPTCTASGSGAGKTLTATTSGPLTVDSVTTALNDRILVKNQSTGSDDGIYKETTVGVSGAYATWTWTALAASSITGGSYITYTGPASKTFIWFIINGVGTMPSIPGYTDATGGLGAQFASSATSSAVASGVSAWAGLLSQYTSTYIGSVVTVTCTATGPVMNNTTYGSGFSPGVTGQTAVNFILTRSPDFSANVLSGMQVPVTAGTVNTGKTFTLTTANPITVDTTALTFS